MSAIRFDRDICVHPAESFKREWLETNGLGGFASSTIVRDIGYESIDIVAGGETAGIPFAAWIADNLMLPMQYVRKKAKGFGRNPVSSGVLQASRGNTLHGECGRGRLPVGRRRQG